MKTKTLNLLDNVLCAVLSLLLALDVALAGYVLLEELLP